MYIRRRSVYIYISYKYMYIRRRSQEAQCKGKSDEFQSVLPGAGDFFFLGMSFMLEIFFSWDEFQSVLPGACSICVHVYM